MTYQITKPTETTVRKTVEGKEVVIPVVQLDGSLIADAARMAREGAKKKVPSY